MQGRGAPTWAMRCLLSPTLSQEPRSPPGAEAPYCDLPRCRPACEDPLSASASGCQSVVGLGLGPGPERWVELQGLGRGSPGLSSPIPPHPLFRIAASVMAAGIGHMVSPYSWAQAGSGHVPWALGQLRSRVWSSHAPTWVHSPLTFPGSLCTALKN